MAAAAADLDFGPLDWLVMWIGRWRRHGGPIIAVGAILVAGGVAAGVYIPPQFGTKGGGGLPSRTVANEWVNTAAGASPSRCSPACAYNSANAYSQVTTAYQAAQCHDSILVHAVNANQQLIAYTVTKTSASAGCSGISSGGGCHLAEPFPNGATTTDLSMCVFVQPESGQSITFGTGACTSPCASLDIEASYLYFKGFTLTPNAAKGKDVGLKVSGAQARTQSATCTNYLTQEVVVDSVTGAANDVVNGPADDIGIVRSDFGPAYNNVDNLGIAAQTGGCIYSRSASGGATTSGSTTVTATGGAFTSADVGRYLSGTGIPALNVIVSVTNATTVVLTSAATATGSSLTFTLKDSPSHQSTSSQTTRLYVTDTTLHDLMSPIAGQHTECWHFNDGVNFVIARVKFLNCGPLDLSIQSAENVFTPNIGDGLIENTVFDTACSDPNAVPGVSDTACTNPVSGGSLAVICDAPNSIQHLIIRYDSLAENLYGLGEDKGFGNCAGNGWPPANFHIYGNVMQSMTGFTSYPGSYTAGYNLRSTAYGAGPTATGDVTDSHTIGQLYTNPAARIWDYTLSTSFSNPGVNLLACSFDLGAPATNISGAGRSGSCNAGAY